MAVTGNGVTNRQGESWKHQGWLSAVPSVPTLPTWHQLHNVSVPCWLSSPRQRLSPPHPLSLCFSFCSSYLPSLISLVSLPAKGRSCLSPNDLLSPRAPWPSRSTAKTHLGESLPLESKSPEERSCSAYIRCPHLVPLAVEACGSHWCGGGGNITTKGTLTP